MHLKSVFGVLLSSLALLGCTAVNIERMKILSPPQAVSDIEVHVDKNAFNESGEAVTLESGLKRHLALHGYRLAEGRHRLDARIVKLKRGSTAANTLIGLGFGKDEVEVEVRLSNTSGEMLIAFDVSGAVVDKRYADMREMLLDELPEKIVEKISSWGTKN